MVLCVSSSPESRRQLTPISTYSMLTMPPAYAPLTSVWTLDDASSVEKSEAGLLDMYSDDLAVEWSTTDETENDTAALVDQYFAPIEPVGDEADAIERLDLANQVLVSDPHFQSFELCPKATSEPDIDEICRPYQAQSTTLLFDIEVPHDSDMELALRSVVSIETGNMFTVHPTSPGETSPTPVLLDASDMKLKPSRSSSPFCDAVSQMLDFYPSNEALETASEYVLKRAGRSLTHAPLPSAEHWANIDFDDHEVPMFDEQGKHIKRDVAYLDTDKGPRDWEVEYDRVLRQITQYSFLPGHKHLTNVEVRATFLQYDDDIQALHDATMAFLSDRRDGECVCLENKAHSVVLPGENFLIAKKDTGLGLSVEHPTAKSLLDLIDELVADSFSMENFVQSPDALIGESPSLGVFFDSESQQYINYTALDQLSCSSAGVFKIACVQPDAASDVSDNEVDELSMTQPQPSELIYFDADTQQCIAYTAFNQLLMDLHDNDEIVPRIHRADDDYDEIRLDNISEIYDIPLTNNVVELASSPLEVECEHAANLFDFDFASQVQPTSNVGGKAELRTAYNIRSSSSYHTRIVRRRPQLTIITQLDAVEEVSSNEDIAPPSSASSDRSIDFADQQGFVKSLSTRRTDFLDDEDSDVNIASPSSSSSNSSIGFAGQREFVKSLSTRRSNFLDDEDPEDELDVPQSLDTLAPSEYSSNYLTSVSTVVEHSYELFLDDIWQFEPVLLLTVSSPSIRPATPTAVHLPNLDGLVGFETVIYDALAYTFECINNGRIDVLPALGCDIQWALSLFASDFPIFGLLERLGGAVEILLEHLAALGTN
jgi:hypothetical protein